MKSLSLYMALLASLGNIYAQPVDSVLYVHVDKQIKEDTSNHYYTISFLKISGNKCFLDIVLASIIRNDTTLYTSWKTNSYFRGIYTLMNDDFNALLTELFRDNVVNTGAVTINSNGIPVRNRQVKHLSGKRGSGMFIINNVIFKRADKVMTLTSELIDL